MERFDVVVLGAGTAGAAAALQCARKGLSVLAVDRQPLDRAGARWCNAVPGWAFDVSGVGRPVAPEARGAPPVHLVAGWGPDRIFVSGQDVLEVDMRLLVARLQAGAADAGAVLRGASPATGIAGDVVHTAHGPVRARWIVDATGLHGQAHQPRMPRTDLCTAAQQVRAVTDPAAARAWFAQHGASPGEIVCFTAVAGGYAIVNVRLHGDHEMAILTGSLPAAGQPPAVVLLERFVAAQRWIGPVRFGGARAIPVGRPHRRLHAGRVAFLGDAAGQVYAAHGSGVGIQLVSSALLADVFAAGGTPADYSDAWWRSYGGELDASALFQGFSRRIDPAFLGRMMRAGLFVPDLVRASLEQRPPRIDGPALRAIAAGAARDPGAVARVAPVLAGMAARRVLRRATGAPRA